MLCQQKQILDQKFRDKMVNWAGHRNQGLKTGRMANHWPVGYPMNKHEYVSCHFTQKTDRILSRNRIIIFWSDFFIFILLSRESDGGAMRRTNPDSLTSCPCFRVFRLNFASDFFNLLLVRFHQADIIVVKHLIQGRNNEA